MKRNELVKTYKPLILFLGFRPRPL